MSDLHSHDRGDKAEIPAALGTTFTTHAYVEARSSEPVKMPRSSRIIFPTRPFIDDPDCPDCGGELTPGPGTGTLYCQACMDKADEADFKYFADTTTGENARPVLDYIHAKIAALNKISEIVQRTMSRTDEVRFLQYLGEPHRSAELRLRWGKAMETALFVGSEFVDEPEIVAANIMRLRTRHSRAMRELVALRRENARKQRVNDDLNRHLDYLRSVL